MPGDPRPRSVCRRALPGGPLRGGLDRGDSEEHCEPSERARDRPLEGLGEVRHEALELSRGEDRGRGDIAVEVEIGEERDGTAGDLIGELAERRHLDLIDHVVAKDETHSAGHGSRDARRARRIGEEHEDALDVPGEPDARDDLVLFVGGNHGIDPVDLDPCLLENLAHGIDERVDGLLAHDSSIGDAPAAVKPAEGCAAFADVPGRAAAWPSAAL